MEKLREILQEGASGDWAHTRQHLIATNISATIATVISTAFEQ